MTIALIILVAFPRHLVRIDITPCVNYQRVDFSRDQSMANVPEIFLQRKLFWLKGSKIRALSEWLTLLTIKGFESLNYESSVY